MPTVVLTDIEGTTTPIAFVRDTLFPFARARLPALLAGPARPNLTQALAEVARLAPDQAPLDALLGWMDADAKITPLKALQGLLWREGYESGALHGALYPDVAPALRRWRERGVRLAVYSSGSEEAQRLLFGHSVDGNLVDLFDGFFDTRIGAKREAESYGRIAAALDVKPGAILFLSDIAEELDAAAEAGLRTAQLVRESDGTIATQRHVGGENFPAIAKQCFSNLQP